MCMHGHGVIGWWYGMSEVCFVNGDGETHMTPECFWLTCTILYGWWKWQHKVFANRNGETLIKGAFENKFVKQTPSRHFVSYLVLGYRFLHKSNFRSLTLQKSSVFITSYYFHIFVSNIRPRLACGSFKKRDMVRERI